MLTTSFGHKPDQARQSLYLEGAIQADNARRVRQLSQRRLERCVRYDVSPNLALGLPGSQSLHEEMVRLSRLPESVARGRRLSRYACDTLPEWSPQCIAKNPERVRALEDWLHPCCWKPNRLLGACESHQ